MVMAEYSDLRDLLVAARKHIEAEHRDIVNPIEVVAARDAGFAISLRCRKCPAPTIWSMRIPAFAQWLRRCQSGPHRQVLAMFFHSRESWEKVAELLNGPKFSTFLLTPWEDPDPKTTGPTAWEHILGGDDGDTV
jgi:hypothetical protein